MRENRPSGSEGGGTETNRSCLPLYWGGRAAHDASLVRRAGRLTPLR